MEMVLEDIVPQDQISSLTEDQHHPLWQDELVKNKVRDKFGQEKITLLFAVVWS